MWRQGGGKKKQSMEGMYCSIELGENSGETRERKHVTSSEVKSRLAKIQQNIYFSFPLWHRQYPM